MRAGLFSYSHKDEQLRDELAAHLAALRREGLIEIWHDRRIVAGEPVDVAIDARLEAADIILLLVSPDFLNSDYCYEVEMRRAMERSDRGEAIVIPVILRPCEWRGTPFGHLLAVPKDGRAVTSWSNRDEAFHDVTRAVRAALTEGRRTKKPLSNRDAKRELPEPKAPRVRLPRTFSEKDKDDFLEEAFVYIADLFRNSLAELERENNGIEGRFRPLDASRFTAVAYRGGRAISRCTVWVGGRNSFVGGIGYVENDSGATSSFNESLTVEIDDQALCLKAIGMSFVGSGRTESALSIHQAAEFLWNLFIRRLQEHS